MSIFYIPKEEIDSIRPLLSKIAEQRVGAEGVCTLAELDPDKKFAGCIQFCIEETGIPEERDHRAARGACETETSGSGSIPPIINELAVCLECRVKSYDKEKRLLKGEIVNVSVDESALTDGNADVSKVRPICFDPFNSAYHVMGEKVGDAWGIGKSLA